MHAGPGRVGPQGGDADAADVDKMRRLGVRYIVNMARECPNHHESLHEFVYKHVEADDQIESPEEFEQEVVDVCRFIAAAHQRNDGNVFVHCRAGISRSATAVIAYLVQEEHWILRDAIDHVRTARPSVAPNLGFLVLLMGIEKRVLGSDSLSRVGSGAEIAMAFGSGYSAADSTSMLMDVDRRSPRSGAGSYPDSPKAMGLSSQTVIVRTP